MNKCLYCKKDLSKEFYENKVGKFCSESHFDEYMKGLSKEEYIELQHSFCVCSDEWFKRPLRFSGLLNYAININIK